MLYGATPVYSAISAGRHDQEPAPAGTGVESWSRNGRGAFALSAASRRIQAWPAGAAEQMTELINQGMLAAQIAKALSASSIA